MIDFGKFRFALTIIFVSAMTAVTADEAATPRKTWAELMGSWRMTGQAKRGSSQGAWTSPAQGNWSNSNAARQIRISIPESTAIRGFAVRIDPKSGDSVGVDLDLPKSNPRFLDRKAEPHEDRFVFEEKPSPGQDRYRLTIVRKSRDRWTGTLEALKAGSSAWTRIQELGMTRQGTTIAQGSGQPECVVTGGLGEIAVTIGKRTVYVCCSGCRDTLLADPDAFLKPAPSSKESPAGPAGSQSP